MVDLVPRPLRGRGRTNVPAAVVVGHVDWAGRAGVFSELHRLGAGDAIEVDREDGRTATFRVIHAERYAKRAFTSATLDGGLNHAGLRLITCGGVDPQTRSYVDNIVVFAELVAGDRSVS